MGEQRAEELRQEAAKRAWALIEKNPEYPGVVVQVNDSDRDARRNRSEAAKERLTGEAAGNTMPRPRRKILA